MSQKRTIEITENDSNKKQKKTTHIQNALSAPNFKVKRIFTSQLTTTHTQLQLAQLSCRYPKALFAQACMLNTL